MIMRVFVSLRKIISSHKKLALKLEEFEQKLDKHDQEIMTLFQAIRQLMAQPPEPSKPKIGFHE